jgi:hypothetical protein
MNLFDFYFRQIVTQTVMDWTFAQAQLADHDQSVDNVFVGIMNGLGVVENHLGPDMSVDIDNGVAYTDEGARVFEADVLTNLDCSVDEYNVPTAVVNPGNERWLTVFARFTRDLQDPAIDGNGLEVYTKQLEDCELIVHQGAEAAVGLASRPAMIENAVLLADINLAFGQTTIQTALHIHYDRRQDWTRVVGTTLADFVHGNAKDAVEELYTILDTWAASGSPFVFSETWWGVQPVLGPTPPPVNVSMALDAIVYDLARAFTPSGASRVGIEAFTGPGTYVSWPNTNIESAMGTVGTSLDAHIGGAPPQHPASSITFNDTVLDAIFGWGPGTYTDVQAAVDAAFQILNLSLAGNAGSEYIGVVSLTGDPESSAAPHDLSTVLQEIFDHLNDRPERNRTESIPSDINLANPAVGWFMTGSRFSQFGTRVNWKQQMNKEIYRTDVSNQHYQGAYGGWANPLYEAQPAPFDAIIDLCPGWDENAHKPVLFVVSKNYAGIGYVPLGDGDVNVAAVTFNGTSPAATNTYVSICSDGWYVYLMGSRNADNALVIYKYNTNTNPGQLTYEDHHYYTGSPFAADAHQDEKSRIKVGRHTIACTCVASSDNCIAIIDKYDLTNGAFGRGNIPAGGGVSYCEGALDSFRGDTSSKDDHYAFTIWATGSGTLPNTGHLAAAVPVWTGPTITGIAAPPLAELAAPNNLGAHVYEVLYDGQTVWMVGVDLLVAYHCDVVTATPAERFEACYQSNYLKDIAPAYPRLAFDGVRLWWCGRQKFGTGAQGRHCAHAVEVGKLVPGTGPWLVTQQPLQIDTHYTPSNPPPDVDCGRVAIVGDCLFMIGEVGGSDILKAVPNLSNRIATATW